MNVAVRVYDWITRVAPLGVRFWDAATDTPVRAGLQVAVYPIDDPRLQVLASQSERRARAARRARSRPLSARDRRQGLLGASTRSQALPLRSHRP